MIEDVETDAQGDQMNQHQARQEMILSARAFYGHGWMMGTSGNLSVRMEDDRFLITASGKDKGALTDDDFLLCDLAGRPVEDTSNRPSAETLVHCVIYRRFPEVRAIYHVHQVHAALCSARDRAQKSTSFADLEMIKGLDVWEEGASIAVPILDNLHDIPALARHIDEFLESPQFDPRVPGVNLYNHGLYAWGDSTSAAKRHIETFGYLFEYGWELSK
ncbi:MAG: methylthioribulose 1-phosphate dehydratase [Bradymonadaceae bacterium]